MLRLHPEGREKLLKNRNALKNRLGRIKPQIALADRATGSHSERGGTPQMWEGTIVPALFERVLTLSP